MICQSDGETSRWNKTGPLRKQLALLLSYSLWIVWRHCLSSGFGSLCGLVLAFFELRCLGRELFDRWPAQKYIHHSPEDDSLRYSGAIYHSVCAGPFIGHPTLASHTPLERSEILPPKQRDGVQAY